MLATRMLPFFKWRILGLPPMSWRHFTATTKMATPQIRQLKNGAKMLPFSGWRQGRRHLVDTVTHAMPSAHVPPRRQPPHTDVAATCAPRRTPCVGKPTNGGAPRPPRVTAGAWTHVNVLGCCVLHSDAAAAAPSKRALRRRRLALHPAHHATPHCATPRHTPTSIEKKNERQVHLTCGPLNR